MALNDLKLNNSIRSASNDLTKSFEKLSSGKRINKAADDAAGLAIVSALEADIKTNLQAARNAVDGISIADIADSALGQVSDITVRQQELAAQSANGTLSDDQRAALDAEYQALEQEKGRILSSTEFNGVNVFSGGTLQVGNDSSANSQISLPSVDTASVLSAQSIATQGGAQAAIDSLNSVSSAVGALRGQVGAAVSRVEAAEQNARSEAVAAEAAASRIRDVDVAEESAKLTASRIRQQSSVALQAQAGNINADTVLRLLS